MNHDDARFHDDMDRLLSASFDEVPRPELSRGFTQRVAKTASASRRAETWGWVLEFVAAFAAGVVLARALRWPITGPTLAIVILFALVLLPALLVAVSAFSARRGGDGDALLHR